MLSGTTLYIRCDYTPTVGAGHLMRCFAIAEAWSASGGGVVLLGECANEEMAKSALWRHIAFTTRSLQEDLEITRASIDATSPHVLVVDGYQFDGSYLAGLAASGRVVLFLDDLGKLPRYPVNVILNQNLSAYGVRYPTEGATQTLLGPKYFLLRRELAEVLEQRHRAARGATKILITLGLGPDEGVLAKILQSLASLGSPELAVRIIVPAESPPPGQLVAETATRVARLELLPAPQPMAEHYQWSDIAVCAGGTTALELAAMGVPIVVVSLADNQLATAQRLEELNVACFVGSASEVRIERLRDAISTLLVDSEKRRAMVKAGSELIDGRGPSRVVEVLRARLAEENTNVS